MLPSDLTLSALRFILFAKSGQSCKQDCETIDCCNSLHKVFPIFVDVLHMALDEFDAEACSSVGYIPYYLVAMRGDTVL